MASALVVSLIGAALSVTIWSYRRALDAHALASASLLDAAAAHAAEARLWHEREAMNEYLLAAHPDILGEVHAMKTAFESELATVGDDDVGEGPLTRRARAANDAFLALFARDAPAALRDRGALERLIAALGVAEDKIVQPLRSLRTVNARQARERQSSADASGRQALLAGIVAGAIAIGAGLGFAFYTVRLVGVIAARNERLRKLDRMKDDFVASVSHELRTPLTSIRGYLELVLEGEAGEVTADQERFLMIVKRNSDRLLRVVGDLLFMAQVDAGTISLEPDAIDVDQLAREAVDAAGPAAAAKNIRLELELGGVPELQADRARLAQVVDNLVSNAVKFTPDGGRVAVCTFRERDLAVLEVVDTGMGISEEDQKQLFQRFFRTARATEEAIQGTGLGLAIAKAIVEAHDGTITVASSPGEGTTFRVELPLERAQVAV